MKKVVAILVLILIAGGIWFWKFRTDYVAHQFTGKVERMEGNVLFVRGEFLVENKDDKYERNMDQLVEVKVTDATKITINEFVRPTPPLDPKGYKLSDLENRILEGQISDLLNQSVTVTAERDVYNKDSFSAQKIEFGRMTD